METEGNIYAPPKAPPPPPMMASSGGGYGSGPLYVVAPYKFALLFIATLGLYQVYFFYKNWSHYKANTGEAMWPVMRGIFSVFFVHALFRHVDFKINHEDRKFSWNPGSSATTFVLLAILSNGLDRAAGKNMGFPWVDLLSYLCLFLLVAVLYRPVQAINLASGDPQGSSNASLTFANIIWLAIGLVFWGFIAFGWLVNFGLLQVP